MGNTRVAVAVAGIVGCAIEVGMAVAVAAIRVGDGKGVVVTTVGPLTNDA